MPILVIEDHEMLVIGSTAGFRLQERAPKAVGKRSDLLAEATNVLLIRDRMQQNGNAAMPLPDSCRCVIEQSMQLCDLGASGVFDP